MLGQANCLTYGCIMTSQGPLYAVQNTLTMYMIEPSQLAIGPAAAPVSRAPVNAHVSRPPITTRVYYAPADDHVNQAAVNTHIYLAPNVARVYRRTETGRLYPLRTIFSPQQRFFLETYASEVSVHPNPSTVREIANQLGLPYRVVQIWFRNKRRRLLTAT